MKCKSLAIFENGVAGVITAIEASCDTVFL
jgi:hypothetical protein